MCVYIQVGTAVMIHSQHILQDKVAMMHVLLLVLLISAPQGNADKDLQQCHDESDIEDTLIGNAIYSSFMDLLKLTIEEKKIRKTVLKWIKRQERRSPHINLEYFKKYMENDNHFFKKDASPDEVISYPQHPINCFMLIKNWYNAMTFLSENKHFPEFEKMEKRLHENYLLPTLKDMYGASTALIRLQRTYNMTCQQMINGTIEGQKPHQPLSVQDYRDLGLVALMNMDYRLATDWLKLVIEKAKPGDPFPDDDTYKGIASAYYNMGDLQNARRFSEMISDYNPNDPMLSKELSDVTEDAKNSFTERVYPKFQLEFEALCRGEADQKMNATYTKNLFCRYKAGKLPYVVYKEEILSWDPRISQFYEVISEKTVVHIIGEAAPVLKRAQVHDENFEPVATLERVSKVTRLNDNKDEILHHLNLQISDITGLDIHFRLPHASAELFEVINYGIAGYYRLHWDFQINEEVKDSKEYTESGDRIATFMFYLADVKHGGHTVFPKLNLTIPAIKFAAVFWYNTNLSGEFDKRTLHGGCPVLLGQKWVMTKWIREFGQEFRRPCGLNQNDVDYS